MAFNILPELHFGTKTSHFTHPELTFAAHSLCVKSDGNSRRKFSLNVGYVCFHLLVPVTFSPSITIFLLISTWVFLDVFKNYCGAYPINNKGIELQRTNEDVQTKTLVLFLERVYAVSIASLCECVRVCMREYVGACVQLPMQTSTFCFSTTYSCNGRIKQVCCIDYCQIGTDRWTDIFVLMLWYDSDAEGQKLLVDIWCTTEILCERKRIYLSNSKK